MRSSLVFLVLFTCFQHVLTGGEIGAHGGAAPGKPDPPPHGGAAPGKPDSPPKEPAKAPKQKEDPPKEISAVCAERSREECRHEDEHNCLIWDVPRLGVGPCVNPTHACSQFDEEHCRKDKNCYWTAHALFGLFGNSPCMNYQERKMGGQGLPETCQGAGTAAQCSAVAHGKKCHWLNGDIKYKKCLPGPRPPGKPHPWKVCTNDCKKQAVNGTLKGMVNWKKGSKSKEEADKSGGGADKSGGGADKSGAKQCCPCNEKDCPSNEEMQEPDGSDYRGCKSKTLHGFTCQNWKADEPNNRSIAVKNKVKAKTNGLGDHNYCRNPDGEPTIWCYTTDKNKRWDFCIEPRRTIWCYTTDRATKKEESVAESGFADSGYSMAMQAVCVFLVGNLSGAWLKGFMEVKQEARMPLLRSREEA